MCTLLCVCPPRVESLFPPFISKFCNQIPLAFKVWFSRNASSHCLTPRLWSLTWGSDPSLEWVDFCGIIALQFVSHPPSSYGIWFHCDCAPPTISLWLLLCLWMWGIFFGEFQRLPVNDFAAVSCDSGALARGSEGTSFYSAILNPAIHLDANLKILLVMDLPFLPTGSQLAPLHENSQSSWSISRGIPCNTALDQGRKAVGKWPRSCHIPST